MQIQGQARTEGQETALLAQLRSGDEQAFAALVHLYGGRLLATARRILRDEEDARDAVQQAFLSASQAMDGFVGQARLSTWLHRIVVNSALMKLRKQRRHPESSIENLLPRFHPDGHRVMAELCTDVSAEAMLETRETRLLVRQAIDRLPESYRTVLLLRDIEELDTEEAADVLGVSANAVKVRLHRARQALRTLLEQSFARD